MAWKCPVCNSKLKQLRGKNTIVPFFIISNHVCTNCIGKDHKPLSVKANTELVIQNGTKKQMSNSGSDQQFINALKDFIDRYE